MNPTVSVIIPTFNHADFIGNSIRSALSQTIGPLEVIVVDNYSTDSTEAVVGRIDDPRIKYFRFNNRGIIAAGRNFGLKHSRGEILAFLDSDDEWKKNKIEEQAPHLEDHRIACVGSNYVPIGDVIHTKRHLHFRDGEAYRDYRYRDVVLANPVMTSSAMVRKADLIRIGGFDESAKFCFIEDWELWLRLCADKKIRILSNKLITYRIGLQRRDQREIAENVFNIFNKHLELNLIDRAAYTIANGNACVTAGRAYLEANDSRGKGYYVRGLYSSKGLANKVRALGGLIIYMMPSFFRRISIEAYYHVRQWCLGD